MGSGETIIVPFNSTRWRQEPKAVVKVKEVEKKLMSLQQYSNYASYLLDILIVLY